MTMYVQSGFTKKQRLPSVLFPRVHLVGQPNREHQAPETSLSLPPQILCGRYGTEPIQMLRCYSAHSLLRGKQQRLIKGSQCLSKCETL